MDSDKSQLDALGQFQELLNSQCNGNTTGGVSGFYNPSPFFGGGCPSCGYCGHCGRGGRQFMPYWGVNSTSYTFV